MASQLERTVQVMQRIGSFVNLSLVVTLHSNRPYNNLRFIQHQMLCVMHLSIYSVYLYTLSIIIRTY